MSHSHLVSIQVGMPREYGKEGAGHPMDRPWYTGFLKERISGPVQLHWTNLEGDGQADLVHHGGRDKAVLAYSADHYDSWRREMSHPDLPFGAFGENFTLVGLTERDVCIGDRWAVGETVQVQISQPRQPCWKLARRWKRKTLALEVQQSGRTGWYFRVLIEGTVAAGMTLTLLERPYPEWSVERANQIMHNDKQNMAAALELASIPLLSENWQATLLKRGRGVESDPAKRLIGQNEDGAT